MSNGKRFKIWIGGSALVSITMIMFGSVVNPIWCGIGMCFYAVSVIIGWMLGWL